MPSSAEYLIASQDGLWRAEILALLHITAGSPGYPQAGGSEIQIASHKTQWKAEVLSLLMRAVGLTVIPSIDAGDEALAADYLEWKAGILESLADNNDSTVPIAGNAEYQITAHCPLWKAECLALLRIIAGNPAIPSYTVGQYLASTGSLPWHGLVFNLLVTDAESIASGSTIHYAGNTTTYAGNI